MLTSFDDFPLHQTSMPIALTAGSDPNHYDRYFFNGYHRDGSLYFAAAMGLYPNRHVADAAFSVVHGGLQVSVHASRRAPTDRRDATEVGPVHVVVEEPLSALRVLVDAPEHGLRANVLFRRRTVAIEEAPYFHRVGQRVMMDSTRLTQFGTWEGWVELDGVRHECNPSTTWGSRDRSWGVRPVGERAPLGAPIDAPQFFWLWTPVNFEGFCAHFDVNELSDGRRWHEGATVTPVGDGPPEHLTDATWEIDWMPGTRHASEIRVRMPYEDGGIASLVMRRRFEFQMLGIGYGHPEWSHGVWKGELAVGGERWELPVADPVAPHHVHVQALCDATFTDPAGGVHEGIGILEQMAVGPHRPSGLAGLFDGWQTPPPQV